MKTWQKRMLLLDCKPKATGSSASLVIFITYSFWLNPSSSLPITSFALKGHYSQAYLTDMSEGTSVKENISLITGHKRNIQAEPPAPAEPHMSW